MNKVYTFLLAKNAFLTVLLNKLKLVFLLEINFLIIW